MKKRIISAVVMLAVTFVCVLVSELSRVIFFGIVAELCAYEWVKNFKKRDVHCADWVLYLMVAALTVISVFHCGRFWYFFVLVGTVMLCMTAGVVQSKVSGFGAMFTAAGVAYLGVLFAVILEVSVSRIWLQSLILGCVPTWVCDSCALFGGSRFGNYEGLLPKARGRQFFECDANYKGGKRGGERIVYSNDGHVWYSKDHYGTFKEMFPSN